MKWLFGLLMVTSAYAQTSDEQSIVEAYKLCLPYRHEVRTHKPSIYYDAGWEHCTVIEAKALPILTKIEQNRMVEFDRQKTKAFSDRLSK